MYFNDGYVTAYAAISIPVRTEITAANTSVRVSWEWSCQSVFDIVDLVRVDHLYLREAL